MAFSLDVQEISKTISLIASKNEFFDILQKAKELKSLTLEESAKLLNIEDEELLQELFKAAGKLKEEIYGNRIVLFAPLYVSNYCSNNCLYCGFRYANKNIDRRKLTVEEVVEEAKKIIATGHKRLLLVAGEDAQQCNMDYIEKIINKIYEEKLFNGEIRRININVAPMSVEEFRRLASFGIGTYQSFQETYHPGIYKEMHPSGLKANYQWRLETMDRALEAGLKDIGMGALLGLCDYRFEVLSMLSHAQYLDKTYGTGPHTISIPRLEYAEGSDISKNPPFAIKDVEFKKIVSVLRLSVPYTGIILSTRERPEFRNELLNLGVSQISAGSKTNPGGYTEKQATEQFTVGDNRSLEEMIRELIKSNYVPSFCTSCYRNGRTGKDFMDLAKPGLIKKFCQPNALLTFKEYLKDYASPETMTLGEKLIQNEIFKIDDKKVKERLINQLKQIDQGQRDICI